MQTLSPFLLPGMLAILFADLKDEAAGTWKATHALTLAPGYPPLFTGPDVGRMMNPRDPWIKWFFGYPYPVFALASDNGVLASLEPVFANITTKSVTCRVLGSDDKMVVVVWGGGRQDVRPEVMNAVAEVMSPKYFF